MYEIPDDFNNWMQRYGQKHKNATKMGLCPTCDPQFKKNRALSLLHPYGAQASCKNYKKLMSSLRNIERRTDQWTEQQGRLPWSQSGKGSKINTNSLISNQVHIMSL